jgi:putative intracellular protease/amidase
MSEKRLQGLRVAVLAVDGFEQVEVTIPMRALRRAGADVRIVSLRPGRIRGIGLLGGAAAVTAGGGILTSVLRGRNNRRLGLRSDAFGRRASA